MRVRAGGLMIVAAMASAASGTASACHVCRQTPCVLAPAPMPAYQCVTEMVPYTVNRLRTRVEFQAVTETVPYPVPETTYIERQRTVCRPVFDTTYVQRTVTFCRPVTTTRQVTEYCLQPTTELVNVPVPAHTCGHCGKVAPACGCATVARTCYTPVPVVRDVPVTQFVPETRTEDVPIVHCRMVSEVVTDRIPVTTVHCVPKTITRQIPIPIREMVAETCYRPVTRVVPLIPAPAPAPQAVPTASGQG